MNPAADRYTVERVTEVRAWTPSLFSFKTTRHRSFRFVAGQFARLGVRTDEGGIVWRAYSIVSAPYDEHLEFYSIVVPGGEFTSRLARLKSGELERAAGLPLCQERARIMICGNPEMVEDTRELLLSRGFSLSRRGQPGHLALENLW